MRNLAIAAAGLVLTGIGLVGCSGAPGIGDRIRAADSPLIQDVQVNAGITGSGDIRVVLVPGATRDQGVQVWCEIVVPALGGELGKIPVAVWSSDPPKAGVNPILAENRTSCST